jgi:hypothetical protein
VHVSVACHGSLGQWLSDFPGDCTDLACLEPKWKLKRVAEEHVAPMGT